MKTQDEIIGAIENIILSSGEDEMAAFQEIAEAWEQYLDGDEATSFVLRELEALVKKVQGAATWTNWTLESEAAERVENAIAEIGGQY